MLESRFETVENRTYKVKAGFERAVEKALRKAGFDIEAKAKLNVTEQKAIDTGALRASIYTVTPHGNTYAAAEAEATEEAAKGSRKKRKSGKAKPKPFTMLPMETAEADETVVSVGAEYAGYVEHGTVFMAPRPFFEPAINDVMAVFDDLLVNMINKELDSL